MLNNTYAKYLQAVDAWTPHLVGVAKYFLITLATFSFTYRLFWLALSDKLNKFTNCLDRKVMSCSGIFYGLLIMRKLFFMNKFLIVLLLWGNKYQVLAQIYSLLEL